MNVRVLNKKIAKVIVKATNKIFIRSSIKNNYSYGFHNDDVLCVNLSQSKVFWINWFRVLIICICLLGVCIVSPLTEIFTERATAYTTTHAILIYCVTDSHDFKALFKNKSTYTQKI